MTAKAVAVTEAAVKWVKKPSAVGGPKRVTMSGSVDVASFVYCGVSKAGTRRLRMLNTTNATNKTTTTTPAKPVEVVSLQSAATAKLYHVQRFEAKAGALTFSMVFKNLGEGKLYGWMCEATSLSPANPKFRTAMEKGSVKT